MSALASIACAKASLANVRLPLRSPTLGSSWASAMRRRSTTEVPGVMDGRTISRSPYIGQAAQKFRQTGRSAPGGGHHAGAGGETGRQRAFGEPAEKQAQTSFVF